MSLTRNLNFFAPDLTLIADDLTGACDAGIYFVSDRSAVDVLLSWPAQHPSRICIISTESRDVDSTTAVQRITYVCELAANSRIFFKKIDSSVRGNTFIEIAAVLRHRKLQPVVLCPALPQQGRVVRDGILHIEALQTADYSIDLFTRMVSQQCGSVLRTPITQVQSFVERAAPGDILLCECTTEADLQQIADTALLSGKQFTWIGSSGLARALSISLGYLQRGLTPQVGDCASAVNGRHGPLLFYIGSMHPVTAVQLSNLSVAAPAEVLSVKDASGSVLNALFATGVNVVLRTACTQQEESRLQMIWSEFDHALISAVVLSGGQSAIQFCRAVDGSTIRLHRELLPGIPQGFLRGPGLDNLCVITKAGGFGTPDTFVKLTAIHGPASGALI